jgi:L-asparaginase
MQILDATYSTTLFKDGVEGIVLAGTGEGNTTDEVLAGLRDAVRHGVTVVRSTRVGSGSRYGEMWR